MALEDDSAVEARAFDRLPLHDDGALARRIEAREDIQHRGLAAAGMADHAGKLATRHREPEILEDGCLAPACARIALGNALEGDESVVGHLGKLRSGGAP